MSCGPQTYCLLKTFNAPEGRLAEGTILVARNGVVTLCGRFYKADDYPEFFKSVNAVKMIDAAILLEALKKTHCCATLRDDGTCDGCVASEAIAKAEGR